MTLDDAWWMTVSIKEIAPFMGAFLMWENRLSSRLVKVSLLR